MKSIFSLLSLAVLMLTLTACGESKSDGALAASGSDGPVNFNIRPKRPGQNEYP